MRPKTQTDHTGLALGSGKTPDAGQDFRQEKEVTEDKWLEWHHRTQWA